MNAPIVLAQELIPGNFWLPLTIVAIVFLLFVFLWLYARRYVKAGPNEVLVISGRKRIMKEPDGTTSTVGFRITKGGGAFIWPIVEKYDILSLEIMTIDVKTPEVYTITGVPVLVDGVAQIKVKGDDVSISTAAEQFLSMSLEQIMNIATQTLEGHLRAIVGTLTVEEIYKNRDAFAQRVQEVAAADLANMGLTIISFTLRDIRDNQGYLDALGKPRTAQVKRDAIIAQAEADRDSVIKSAQANQAGQEAKFAADAKVAEANRDYQMKVADYTASVNLKKAEADLAYDLQKNKTNQSVKAEEIQITVIEKQKQIEVQEKEILRRQKELEATVSRPADAERYRVQTLAEAEKFKLQTEASGEAEAKRLIGTGEADASKARGLAEADVILAQGSSTAQAMQKKADAWRSYTEAAIVQIFLENAPAIANAIAQPLAKMDKIVVINNSDNGAGASQITKDVTNVMAQLPDVVKALSGLDLNEVLSKLQKIGASKPPEEKKQPLRLLEAIIAANNAAGGRPARIDPRPYDAALPLAALTCIDPRLNHLFPHCLGLADDDFIWLRNAGNVITGPATSTVRSVAMSVFLKHAREIAVIGHSDCRMSQIAVNDLLDRMKARGISRGLLPIANMHEFFGLFSNARSNVIKGVGFLRTSPVIPHDAPIHGLLVDTPTGRLEWVVNGYETAAAPLQAHDSPEQMTVPYAPGPVNSVGRHSTSPPRHP